MTPPTASPVSRLWSLLALLLLLLLALPAAAQDSVTDDDVNAVAKKLYCPVCESTPLDVCPTQACRDWRAEIRRQLEAGASEADIQDYFVARYGDRVLAAPRTQGFPLLAWVMPIGIVVLGGIGFGIYLRRIRHDADVAGADSAESAPSPIPPDDYAARIEQEVRRDA